MSGVTRISVFIIFLALLVIFTGAVAAVDWNVSAGSSIQTVINSASENDTIIVNDNNGTAYNYTENVVINKKINLQAASDLVTIHALNSSKPILTINSMGSGTTIQDFIITGATNSSAIYLNSANNCLITGNDLKGNYNGIQLYKSSNNIITDNTISNNKNIGMYIYTNSNSNYVQNNCLTSNHYGIYIINTINNQIIVNTIENITYYAVYINYANSTTIDQNIFTNNNYGIYLRNSQNNTIIRNSIFNTSYYGIYLSNNTKSIITQNTIDSCNMGIYLNTNSNNNYILENILTSNLYGIIIKNSLDNLLSGNEVNNSSSYAFYFNNVNNTAIAQNNIINNNYGIYLYNSQNNTINQNTLSNTTRIGMYIKTNSNNNHIQNNTLIGNQYGINTYNSKNNTIIENSIFNTSYYGIYLSNSTKSIITQNTINNSNSTGIYLNTNSTSNNIENNIVSRNRFGIYLNGNSNDNHIQSNILTLNQYGTYSYITQNNIITSNTINNNTYDGIYLYNSSTIINFNRIIKNGRYGLYNVGNGTVNATNNWWGSNVPIISSTSGSDIRTAGGTVTYNPWLVLNITTTSEHVPHNGAVNLTIDLTHDNNGNDSSPFGNIPDGIPIYFNTTLGTITSPVSTRNGKVNATLSCSLLPGTAIVTVSLDEQIFNKTLEMIGIYNERTHKGFSTIQSAINDNDTINSDTISIGEGTYIENVVVNKKLTLISSYDIATVKAANPSNPVFTINFSGSGSTIQGLNITGATGSYGIYINSASNCSIIRNIVSNNGAYGISVSGLNLTVINNTVTNNGNAGIVINSDNAVVFGNNVTNNGHRGFGGWSWDGINLTGANVTVIKNNVTGNSRVGISVNGNNAQVLQNSIVQNGGYGINAAGLNATIIGNNVTNNGNAGIVVNGNNGIVSENNVAINGHRGFGGWSWDGISITGNNVIITSDNIIHDNGRTGLYVRGNNIKLTGFNIYNNGGYGIEIAGLNITITDNNITNNGNAGLVVNSANATVIGNNAINNGNRGFGGWSWDGISITGINAMVTENTVTGNGRVGITVNGDNARILQNNIILNGGYGINTVGLNITVIGNNATNNGNAGIVINGANSTISNNTAVSNGNRGFGGWSWDGISITGNNPIITPDNIIHSNGRTGLFVRGDNVVLNGFNIYNNGGYGIEIAGQNITVTNNTINNNSNAGIVINGPNATVIGNNAINNGNRGFGGWSWDGISITGINAMVTENTVTGNGRVGITVNGDNAQILQNNIIINGGYGINAAGLNATIIGNNVTNNGNAGIVINGDYGDVCENSVAINGNRGFGGWSWDGIYVRGSYVKILQNSIIQNNRYGINVAGINLTISANTISSNGLDGVNVNGANTTIILNNVTSNSGAGVYVNGADTIISDNTATNNQYGIYLYNSTGTAQNNNLTGNQFGIYLFNSSVNVNFNRIISNSKYGLYNTGNEIVNATDNWWGSNNGPLVSSNSPSDIYISSGIVTYNSWLILGLTAHPAGTTNSSTITADLTHNNQGNDTSSQGNIPDNIPITFITTMGNITNPAYTRNGKANATFNRGTVSSGIANVTTTLDNQTVHTNVVFGEVPLAIIVNPRGGMYNTTQNVTLITVDPGCNSTTYYTLDGSDPKVNGIVYLNPITINTTTTLRYIAGDPEGNWGPQYTQTYIIDTTPPTVTTNVKGGVYNTTQTVNLTAADDYDPNPVIYYTTDGSNPTISSEIYTDPITLQINLTTRTIIDLKFMAVDLVGNNGEIKTESYVLTLPVVNINNNNAYSTIQDAINDNSTINGNVIQICSGTHVESIIVNKKLTIIPFSGNNVTIKAADSNGNVFTITSEGNGSIIQGLTINGNINLQANNCTIYLNNIIGNGTSGIITSNSFNNTIACNNISCNGFNGIQTNSSSNSIYGNIIYGCESGIYSENSNNNISGNTLTNNLYGIWTYNSTDTIQFNRITQNTYGLRNDMSTINATNNWWGTNNPNPNDIWIVSGNIHHDKWLVLSLNVSTTNSGENTIVTADLAYNNHGENTIPHGHLPNDIPVSFTTSYGAIISTSYTVKGKATTILNLGSTQTATVTVTASLDNQNISTTGVTSTGTAVLTINSTAMDNSTGQLLNITYTIPLNDSVTWLSVLWINKGMFTDELQIIKDGMVVQDKYFNNTAYTTWQNTYPTSVFNAIIYANQYLPFISSNALTNFWNNLKTTYNLTTEEITFIQNHRKEFIDNLSVNIVYSGAPGLNLTITDPKDNHVINLNFPGNVIQRSSQILYTGPAYEGVKSFAIATTKVTDNLLQYWLDQPPSYLTGVAMNATYNSFLTALLVEYLHDKAADNCSSDFNVTWNRTSPIIVSACDEIYESYLTLECDHSMGMTVVGRSENIIGFNYAISSIISPIECAVMNGVCGMSENSTYQSYSPNGLFSSVLQDMHYDRLFNINSVETFEHENFIILKSIIKDDYFIVIDTETGIVRDINTVNNFCGAYSSAKRFLGMISEFYRHDNPVGESVYFSSRFFWDGEGQVFITNSCDSVAADDELIIAGPGGTIVQYYGAMWNPGPPIDITRILEPGYNNIQVIVQDLFSSMIGCTSLVLVQVYEPIYYDQESRRFDPYYFIKYNMDDIFTKYDDIENEHEGPGAAENENTAIQDLLDCIKEYLCGKALENNNNNNGGEGGVGGVGGVNDFIFDLNPPIEDSSATEVIGAPYNSNTLNWQNFWRMVTLSVKGIKVGPTSFRG